ncbi:MAG: PhnD/SsuA/transferrin family substrate-binding protein [Rubrivivax sp.]|nr:PhnD/SsuA/transferrin family substrate-binding protein [Rubrivivax sp.]
MPTHRRTPLRRLIAHLSTAAVLALGAPAHADDAAVTVGILAPQGEIQAAQAWAQLAEVMHAALPERQFVLKHFDLPGLNTAVAGAQVDFFIANSGFYVNMEAAHGARRIATLQSPQALSPAEGIASAVLVRRGRPDLRTWSDLKGKRLMGVNANAFGGFQLVWREMKAAGVDPHTDLAALQFAGFPLQNIVAAVRRGDTDAGIVRACLLEEMVRQGQARADEFDVLMPQGGPYPCARSTPLYPDWPFAALKRTPNDLAKRVASALLAMPPSADAYAWTVPTDYQPVRELFRDLEIGPYADLRERSVAGFVRRHWPWFVLALAGLLGWAVHSLRVNRLVERRTAQLRQALTERERLEHEARAQQEKLDHLSRLGVLGEMSSMLAHELNQPLSAIANFARGMARRIEAGRVEPEPLLAASNDIAEQAQRASGIMQRIRGFAGKRAVRRERLDLRPTLDGAVQLFVSMLTQPPSLEQVFDEGARGPWVQADRLQVEQVLLNLMKNALDAMAGLPPAQRRIVLHTRPDGEHFRISVTDNGSGLAPEATLRLFQPFFTTKPDGVGLGLAICKRVVEAHGGRLWAEPAPQGEGLAGLTLSFTLPRSAPEPDA